MIERQAITRKLRNMHISPQPIQSGNEWQVAFPEILVMSKDLNRLTQLSGSGSSAANAILDAFNHKDLDFDTVLYVEDPLENPRVWKPYSLDEKEVLVETTFI